MSPTELISIVVTTYNRSDALTCVLGALDLQTDMHFEVVVADDGSREDHVAGIEAAMAKCSYPVKHVWHPDVGFTAAKVRNLGVAEARGDYLILLDGDCIPEVDFVERHRNLAEAHCFVNGSRVLLSPSMTQLVLDGHVGLTNRNLLVWLMRRVRGLCSKTSGALRLPDLAFRKQRAFRWKGIRSCNMGLSRSDYVSVNGFDETFVGWGHEDADFVLRLHNAGLTRKNGFYSTEVYHLWHREHSRDMENVNAQRVRERMGSKVVHATSGYEQSLSFADVRISSRR
jgi:glycosyltransferase involved in cell wall biosynthesis